MRFDRSRKHQVFGRPEGGEEVDAARPEDVARDAAPFSDQPDAMPFAQSAAPDYGLGTVTPDESDVRPFDQSAAPDNESDAVTLDGSDAEPDDAPAPPVKRGFFRFGRKQKLTAVRPATADVELAAAREARSVMSVETAPPGAPSLPHPGAHPLPHPPAAPDPLAPEGEPVASPRASGAAAPGPLIPPARPLPETLHVALDIRTLRMSGLGTYVRELLEGSARLELPIAWTLVGPHELAEELPESLEVARWIELDRPLYNPKATLAYPRLGGVDVFHYPHYNVPWWRGRRTLVTVFDLFHLHYGNWLRRRYQAHFLRRLRWGRQTIVTASEKTRQELMNIVGIAPHRLRCVPLGPGHRVPAAPPREPAPTRALNGRILRPPWLLAVAIDQPHKNFDFLLSALSLYFQRRPDSPPLIWTGLSQESCQKRARQLPASMRGRIALEPFSTRERLEELYAGATALVFPSLDEGFGLPPLEAMARGVPVICARREPMISILGNAPLYFEPTESASLWRVIDRMLDMASIRQEVVRRGLMQARRYDWDATVRATHRIYLELAGYVDPEPEAVPTPQQQGPAAADPEEEENW